MGGPRVRVPQTPAAAPRQAMAPWCSSSASHPGPSPPRLRGARPPAPAASQAAAKSAAAARRQAKAKKNEKVFVTQKRVEEAGAGGRQEMGKEATSPAARPAARQLSVGSHNRMTVHALSPTHKHMHEPQQSESWIRTLTEAGMAWWVAVCYAQTPAHRRNQPAPQGCCPPTPPGGGVL